MNLQKQKIRKNKIKPNKKNKNEAKNRNKTETFFEKYLIFFVLFCQFLLN